MRERERRRWRLLIHVVVVALLACGASVAAAPKWTQLQSENFLFIGDASEGQIRRVAERLEEFRDALLSVLPGTSRRSSVPTIVMVFNTDRSMTPAKPLFRGNPIEVAGYFQGGEDVNYIAVNADDLQSAVAAIYHEYTHFLIKDRQGPVPVWVGEGLAELYETTEPSDDGKTLMIGRAPGAHVALLQSSTLMPIKDLMAVDHTAAIYNEGRRRSLLYAQSWALVHYLTLGNNARAAQFRKYLSSMQAGTPHDQAFAAAFADVDALDGELFEYVRRFTFPALRLEFAEKSASASVPRGKPLDEQQADAYVADIQARIDRVDDARARVAAIQKRNPSVGRALMVLGAIELRANRLSEAIAHLEKAAALAPDDFIVQITYGQSLTRQMSEVRSTPGSAAKYLPQARQALTRAAAINPGSASAAYMLGYVELVGRGDVAAAVAALTRAVQLDPHREDYRILLVQALGNQGEFDKAISVLGPLLASGRTAAIREDARRMMSELADRRNAGARTSGVASIPPMTGTTPPADTRLEGNRAVLLLRAVQAGEVRVLGTLDAVDCANGRIVLRVSSDGRTLALRAAQFGDIEFISYRSAAPGPVTCGPQQSRDRVYATYRVEPSWAGFDGQAVAVELLPDDFVPPKPR